MGYEMWIGVTNDPKWVNTPKYANIRHHEGIWAYKDCSRSDGGEFQCGGAVDGVGRPYTVGHTIGVLLYVLRVRAVGAFAGCLLDCDAHTLTWYRNRKVLLFPESY